MSTLSGVWLERLLDRMPVARLALLDPSGRPQALPIVYARVGERLFSPIDGKPKSRARLARLALIEREPRAPLLLDHYAADWRQLWWIRLDVDTAIADPGDPEWAAAEAALRGKYPQYATTPLFIDPPTAVVMRWQALRWWAADGEKTLAAWLDDPPSR